jgi:hypothetical protein
MRCATLLTATPTGTAFYKLDERVILKALSVLEKDKRAVVFEGDKTSAKGVKFFPA